MPIMCCIRRSLASISMRLCHPRETSFLRLRDPAHRLRHSPFAYPRLLHGPVTRPLHTLLRHATHYLDMKTFAESRLWNQCKIGAGSVHCVHIRISYCAQREASCLPSSKTLISIQLSTLPTPLAIVLDICRHGPCCLSSLPSTA